MSPPAFVLGFADPDPQIAGLAWSLGGRAGALLAIRGEAHTGAAEVSYGPDGARVEARIGEIELSVEIAPGAGHDLGGEEAPAGGPTAVVGRAEVSASGPGVEEKASCWAVLTAWEGDPAEGASLIRHLALPAAGEGTIVLIATRPEGAGDHAAEHVSAWMIDPKEGATPFVEALLSTQYDGEGMPTRTGLELWPEDPDAHALRAAGSRPLAAPAANGVRAALLHTSADGTTGVGGYLIAEASR